MRNYWEESWERKERRKMERQTMLVRLALVLVIIAIGIVTLIRLDTVLMQQTETLNQLMELRQEVDPVEVEVVEETEAVSLGEFEITHYCTCPVCCGKWSDGITASGEKAEPGITVATDPSVIPTGTVIVIDGHEYIAQDTGSAIVGNRLDILTESHEVAIARGVKRSEVFTIVEKTIH